MYCLFPCARLAAKIGWRVEIRHSKYLLMDFLFPALLVIPDSFQEIIRSLILYFSSSSSSFLLERHRNAWPGLPQRLFSITWGDFWGMLIYDSVWCQYEIFTLPPPPLSFSPHGFFSSLQMPILRCRVSDIGSASASPLCATLGGSLRRAFHLTVACLPPHASHLRHTAPASFRTICLLIDLSLVRRASRILWGEKCILTDSLHTVVYETDEKGGGPDGKMPWAPGGELAVMCWSCLKQQQQWGGV